MEYTEQPASNVFQRKYNTKLFSNDIPGYLGKLDPIVLNAILEPFAHLNTVGVEIGSLHGKSSYTIAKSINPGKLYCIDPWDNFESYDPAYENILQFTKFPKPGTFNSIDFFKKNVKDCDNIIPIQGYSPKCVSDWGLEIDFIFIDGLHQNPSDKENIDFWLPFIKKGGLLIGHDYYTNGEYPDIIDNIRYLQQRLGKNVVTTPNSSVWYFRI